MTSDPFHPPIAAIMSRAPVIPVLTVHRVDDAVPMARALVAGGLPVLEITLRTPAALEAAAAIAAQVPDAVVGLGTITAAEEIERAVALGARFGVSPGFDADLTRAALTAGLPFLPGVATASEIMAARRLGLRHLKFFPAEVSGGVPALKAFAGPFGDVRFCPTGGIGPANMATYLSLPTVLCVGGSWLVTDSDLSAGAWDAVSNRARQARNAAP